MSANAMFSTKFEIKRSVLLTAFPFGRANSDTDPDMDGRCARENCTFSELVPVK